MKKRILRVLQGLFIFSCLSLSISLLVAPQSYAQTCTTPAAVSNVLVDYPNCTSTTCSFTEANCSWSPVSGATSYGVKITEVETNTIVQNKTVTASPITFPVISRRTYRCDVFATNSCGQAGPTGTHSLLCEVDGVFATPTTAPAAPGVTTAPGAPQPTLPPTGFAETATAIGAGSVFLILLGMFFAFKAS